MVEQPKKSLADVVKRIQVEQSGQAMAPWLVEAQLQAIEDRLVSEGAVLERRLGEGRFFAIGAVATISLSIAFGLLIHPSAILAAAWKLRRFLYFDRDWRPHIIAIYVELEGVDREVFEAIHWLSLEPLIVDFEKYEAEDFAGAFGVDAPDLQRLHEHVDADETAVTGALVRLIRSEVLKTDGRRYWIAF